MLNYQTTEREETSMYTSKWKKKIVWRGYVKFDSNTHIYVTFWKRQSYRNSEKLLGGKSEEGGGEVDRWTTKDFIKQLDCSAWHYNSAYLLYIFQKPFDMHQVWTLGLQRDPTSPS